MTKKPGSILHVISGLQLGGVEVAAIYNLSKNAKQLGVKLVVFGRIKNSEHILSEVEPDILKYIEVLDPFKPFYFFKTFLSLINGQPSIIVSSLWKSFFLAAPLSILSNARFVSFIHSDRSFHFLDYIFTQFSLFFASAIFCDSESSAKRVRAKWLRNKPILVVPHFIPIQPSSKTYDDLALFKKQKIQFVFLGRIHKEKRIERCIDFLKYIEPMVGSIEFHLIGADCGHVRHLQEYFNGRGFRSGSIIFHGALSRREAIYTLLNYDVYLQCSPNEGMAMSVLEALSCGMVAFVVPSGEIASYGCNGKNLVYLPSEGDFGTVSLKVLFNSQAARKMSVAAKSSVKTYPKFDESFGIAIKAVKKISNK